MDEPWRKVSDLIVECYENNELMRISISELYQLHKATEEFISILHESGELECAETSIKFRNLIEKEAQKRFIKACKYNNIEEVRACIGLGIDVNGKTIYGDFGLKYAAERYYPELCDILLSHSDINVNLKDVKNNTALMLACSTGYEDITKKILDKKEVDVNAKNNYGLTAAMQAVFFGNIECVKLLAELEYVDWNIQNANGDSAAIFAVKNDCIETLNVLKQIPSINWNLKNYVRFGDTCLTLALKGLKTEIIKILLNISGVKMSYCEKTDVILFWNDFCFLEGTGENIRKKVRKTADFFEFISIDMEDTNFPPDSPTATEPAIPSDDLENNTERDIEDTNFSTHLPVAEGQTILSEGTNNTDRSPGSLKPIVIDGSNVAMSHGGHKVFSVRGIQLTINFFESRGHKNIVTFIPQYRIKANQSNDKKLLDKLVAEGKITLTPSREVENQRITSHDDTFMLDYAAKCGAIVVTRDNFRNLYNKKSEWNEVIKNRILMHTFVGDSVIQFPHDPLGKLGPTLDEFLRF